MAMKQAITILGKRWRDRNGNTYYSARIYVDNVRVHTIKYSYGYESQFEHDSLDWLCSGACEELVITPRSIWEARDHNTVLVDVVDVSRQKDLDVS